MVLSHVVDPVGIVFIEGFTDRIKHKMSSVENVRTAVECILVRSILVPAVLIVGLEIEIMTERLGIDESSAQRRAL